MSAYDVPMRARLAPLRRRGLLALCVIGLVVSAAYATANLRHGTYTAEAVMLVPSGGTTGDPGRADEASKLAATYALAIPQDARVRSLVAGRLGVSDKQARDHMTVANDADTAILRLRYSGSSAAVATAGANAMVRAVLDRSVRRTIRRGSLALVRLPDPPAHNKVGGLTPILIGLIAGIFLAVVLVVGVERSDPRIDDIRGLEAEAPCPVSEIDSRSRGSFFAVLERRRQLIGESTGHVSILPCSWVSAQHARDVALLLAQADPSEVRLDLPMPLLRGNAGRDGRPAVSRPRRIDRTRESRADGVLLLSVANGPDTDGDWEGLALDSDLTVLVVGTGGRVAEVRRAIASLNQFGVTPGWMFLVRAMPRRHWQAQAAMRSARRGLPDQEAAET